MNDWLDGLLIVLSGINGFIWGWIARGRKR